MTRILAILAILGLCAAPAAAQTKPTLTIYAYSAFVGKYGPGAKVKEAFEAICDCAVAFVASDDAGALVGRLKLEGAQTKADVALGLDMNLAADARETQLFAPHGQNVEGLALPVAWSDSEFLPFDWGHLAFVYDSTRLAKVPGSLKELVEDPNGPKILLEDPRSSAPGLGFLLWMQSVYGDRSGEAWRSLKPRIVTFTKGWSEAYGLFLKGEADMVLSYATSPAYHIGAEKKLQYKAALFAEGHYAHVELVGALRTSKQPELARKFLAFTLSETFQSLMPEGNWMMPAKLPAQGLPASFADVIKPGRTLLYSPEEARDKRRAAIASWLDATAQ